MKKLLLALSVGTFALFGFGFAQVSMTADLTINGYQGHLGMVNDEAIFETQVCHPGLGVQTGSFVQELSGFSLNQGWSNLVMHNVPNSGQVDVRRYATHLVLNDIVIPSCADPAIIELHGRLYDNFPVGSVLGYNAYMLSGIVNVGSDDYYTGATSPSFVSTVSVSPTTVMQGTTVQLTLNIAENTYRSLNLPLNVFITNSELDFDANNDISCTFPILEKRFAENRIVISTGQVGTCTYTATVNTNNLSNGFDIHYRSAWDKEGDFGINYFTEHIDGIADVDLTFDLISGTPHSYGDMVQYRAIIYNHGSDIADGYRFYIDYPVAYLEDPVIMIDGQSRPFNMDAAGDYYIEGSFLNVAVNGTKNILISGILKDAVDSNPFTTTVWIDNLPQHDPVQDIESVTTQLQLIDFDIFMTPAVQQAVSGTQISFDLLLANNGDVQCTGEVSYTLPNGQIVFVSASNPPFTPAVNYATDIAVAAHTTRNFATITAEVVDDIWNDDSLFIHLDGRYNCGAGRETVNDDIEIEPIADLSVTKTLTSTNPSQPGDVVEYSILLENLGSASAEIYRLYDLFPATYLHFISASFNGSVVVPNLVGNEYYWQNDMTNLIVPAGGQIEVVLQGSLLSGTDQNPFTNIARIETLDPDLDITNHSDNVSAQMEPRDVDFVLTPISQYAISGTEIVFDVAMTNNSVMACDVDVSYDLPNGVSRVGSQGPVIGNDTWQDDMTANIHMNAGETNNYATITSRVNLQSWADDTLFVTVHGAYTCNGIGPEVVTTQMEIEPISDIVVTKEIISGNPRVDGDMVSYRISLLNQGSATAQGYALYDEFPVALDYADSRFNGVSYTPNLVANPIPTPSWYMWSGNYLTLAPGQTLEVILEGNLKIGYCYGESLLNTARIHDLNDFDGTNDNDLATGVVSSSDMAVEVFAVGDDPEIFNDPVVFEIHYTNSGNIVATGVVISGSGDLEMYNFVSNVGMSPQPVQTANGREITRPLWEAGDDVDPAESGIIILTGYLNADNYLPTTPVCLSVDVNVAGGEHLCGNWNNNHAEVCHMVTGTIADLVIEKTILTDLDTIDIGDPIGYHLNVYNTGTDVATDIQVTDYLPVALDYVNVTTQGGGAGVTCNYIAHNLVCTSISLDAIGGVNDHMSIILTGTLNSFPVEGISLTNTGVVSYPGREFNTGNNISVITNIVPGLADLSITKTVTSSGTAVAGDTIEYNIVYTNIGGRTGEDIVIYDNLLFTGLSFFSANPQPLYWDHNIQSGYWGGADLAVGASRTIHVVAALQDYFEAGTLLPNMAWIETISPEITTGNNVAYATGIITQIQEFQVEMLSRNLTHPNSDTPLWAVSGDVIEFTVRYSNSGNTTIDNALLTFDIQHLNGFPVEGLEGIAPLSLGSIPYGSGGTIVLTGRVGPQNYQYMELSAYLYDDPHAVSPVSQSTARVVEPLICGDGFLTWDEQCDIGTGFGAIGDILPGQECSIIQNNPSLGCELNTVAIVNTGCIDYAYELNAITYTGQYCNALSPVAINQSSCLSVENTEQVMVSTTEMEVDFLCLGDNTDDTTYLRMDCGNGEYHEGYGEQLEGTCHYTGSVGSTVTYTGQCMVGNDLNNASCELPIDFEVSELMCNLTLDSTVVILEYDGDDLYEQSIEVLCETESGDNAEKLTIDCGNGETFDTENSSSFTRECLYQQDEDDLDNLPKTYEVKCIIEDDEAHACEETVISDALEFPICGNGYVEGPYEECDLGDNDVEIGSCLNENGSCLDSDEDKGKTCGDCRIRDEDEFVYQAPACFNTDASISIMKGEIFPFRWNIEKMPESVDNKDDCDGKDGFVIEDSLECRFEIYDGDEYLQEDRSPVYRFERDCFEKERTDEISDYIDDLMCIPAKSSGKYYIENFGEEGSEGFELGDEIDTYGEYKLILDEVRYNVCGLDDPVIYPRVCEVNFAVTHPYLIQKSAFGAVKVSSEEFDIGLDSFYSHDGENILESTDLNKILEIKSSDYQGGTEIESIVNTFVDQQEKLAILVSENINADGVDVVKKVSGKHIYFMEGNGIVTVSELGAFTEPFTIITKGLDVIIEGSISDNVNGMFLVTENDGHGGQITFDYAKEKDCNNSQTVNGIFIAENGFGLEPNGETANLDADSQRCTNGTLHVKGVLIGKNIEDLVRNRRSHLNGWFSVHSDDEEDVQAERREEIFNGAAVLIEYDPSLWAGRLPPGAESFTKALDVYKR